MKIKLEPNQQVFIFSDPHYNHKNICLGTTEWDLNRRNKVRDFSSLEKMNDTIINNINNCAGINDILICLGDFAFGGVESIYAFRSRLICKNIYLVYGNHDEHIINNKRIPNKYIDESGNFIHDENISHNISNWRYVYLRSQNLFSWCGHYLDIEILFPQENKSIKTPRFKFVASHFPMASWDKLGDGRVHLYGHLHSTFKNKLNNRSLDVGMDGNNLKPYNLLDIIKIMKNQPIGNLILKQDHHNQI